MDLMRDPQVIDASLNAPILGSALRSHHQMLFRGSSAGLT
jgi:hypothetical protein